ncbi:MAG: endolytic transglycosylase MltG [Candidatus Falkowbacteria bacterium]
MLQKKNIKINSKIIKFSAIILAVAITIAFSFYSRGVNSRMDEYGLDQKFIINTGATVNQISKNLYDQKLIGSKFFFEVYVWKKDWEGKIKAGEYILNPSMKIKEIAEILIKGSSLGKEVEIKIIEGWNTREISQYFEREGMFQSEELLELVGFPKVDYRYNKDMGLPKDYSNEFSFLKDKPSYYGLEGYLFPDTYRIYKDSSLDDIVVKMLDNLDQKLTNEMREDIKKQGKTIYEIITMASIVEKEVRTQEDMDIVAGIFWDRIKYGQPLESCATLAYILGINKKQYTIEDTKIDSPYNTYRNQGLPPGPICNPGTNAIKSAIYPKYTDYNYFLSRPDTGETVFSETFAEHNTNKAKYLK